MKELFKEKISELVNKFEKEKYHYLSNKYLESEVRQDFLDPFFESLGWDIGNKKCLSPFEREVVVEKGETKGRPDYNFRIEGFTKFYVEAKAPHEPLDKVEHILQAKSYAWNTKDVFIVLLTDFEEFKLFDASLEPDPTHPNRGIIFDFKYNEYSNNIDKLWLLSKEKVTQGSLDELLLKDSISKKFRVPVDVSFLSQIENWRKLIAKSAYKLQPELSVKQLNSIVQRFIDRIIFIKIAEDRKIIESKSLQDIVDIWKAENKRRPIQYHLNILFKNVNLDLNGEIFKEHECEHIEIESDLIADIIENLYFPKSAYRFDVMGIELLGSIYERFLGNTIRTTEKRVYVEEKPEVKKAGGVYYTPKNIVDYIVQNTVGNKINGLSPKEITNIKIIDPACGSGSFLIGAFQYLIDYHLKWYQENPSEINQGEFFPDVIEIDDIKTLSVTKKSSILQNNIFGVDIDPQAVEVTMISLYLKILEGARSLPHKKGLLPSLSNNIKCGNSLIGNDYIKQEKFKFELTDDDKDTINAFDWNSHNEGFGKIINNGGFDCVIGNPPYIGQKDNKDIFEPFKIGNWKEYYERKQDIYYYFYIKGTKLLKSNGFLSFITPQYWLNAFAANKLRKYLSENLSLVSIFDVSGTKVFTKASINTMVFIFNKKKSNKRILIEYIHDNKVRNYKSIISNSSLNENEWNVFKTDTYVDLFKDNRKIDYLGDICHISPGIQTGCDKVSNKHIEKYNLKSISKNEGIYVIDENKYSDFSDKSKHYIKPWFKNSDISRYSHNLDNKSWVIITNEIDNISDFPDFEKHLTRYKKIITNRYINFALKNAYNEGKWWYLYGYRPDTDFETDKIIFPYRGSKPCFSFSTEPYYGSIDVYYITELNNKYDYKYILGILNSKAIRYYLDKNCKKKGDVLEFYTEPMSKIPVPKINVLNKEIVDTIISLVEEMIILNNSQNHNNIKINALDKEIDKYIFMLYNINNEEVIIINETIK